LRPADDSFRGFEDLEARNESTMAGVEEPRGDDKAGGGVVGRSQGSAHAGRYGARPENVSNREPKPRGDDKAD
jgi:hypothetical protein